jgi:hypothetical protein
VTAVLQASQDEGRAFGYSILFVAYFVPTIVAWVRKHAKRTSIFTVNVLLGWTIIGWIIAFGWAFGGPSHHAVESLYQRLCQNCERYSESSSTFCAFCGARFETHKRGVIGS